MKKGLNRVWCNIFIDRVGKRVKFWTGDRMKRSMKIDLNKIKARADKLNEGFETNPWIEVNGYNTMPQLNVDTDPPSIMGTSGIFVKAFVNKETGELKFYPIIMFLPDAEK